MLLTLGQEVFCDCGLDILEYKVVEVRQAETITTYVLKSKHRVGQHRGGIEIVVFINGEGRIKYLELNSTEREDCEFGLEPFTEGNYFTTLEEAKSSFAKTQIKLIDDRIAKLNRDLEDCQKSKRKWENLLKG
jgi:hypothetical protein